MDHAMSNALQQILMEMQKHNQLLDNLTAEIRETRTLLSEVVLTPTDEITGEKMLPRLLVGMAGAVETIGY